MSKKLRVIMYHYTRDLINSRYPAIKGLDYELFKSQLDYIAKNFTVVTMEEVIEAWNSPVGNLPENAALLTFDDGYIDNYLCAYPLLKEHGMQGSFFIPGKTITENVLLDVNKIHFILAAGNIEEIKIFLLDRMDYYRGKEFPYPLNEELWNQYATPNRWDSAETIFVKRMLQTVLPEELRKIISSELFKKYVGIDEDKFARELYMNRDQIKHMKKDGMFIGVHGYDHYWLGNLSDQDLKRDIDKALDVMAEFVDTNHWVLNYPYGNYSDSVLEYIGENGCMLGMTVEPGVAEIGKTNRFLLPRFDCNDFPPKSNNYINFL